MRMIRELAPFNYTKMDNAVFRNNNISDGAKMMFFLLCSTHPDTEICDEYFIKMLNKSQRTIAVQKKELRAAGLILTERTGIRTYNIYVGNSHHSAKHVMRTYHRNVAMAKGELDAGA